MSDAAETAGEARAHSSMKRLWLILPLAGFLALAVLFAVRLNAGDPSRLPSALLNKPVPDFSLPPIEAGAEAGLSSADLSKGVHLVNVWASWCGPCRLEHPILLQLAADKRFDLVGINYKDVPENAQRFLGALGDPFTQNRRRPRRQDGDRLGRLRRAGNLRREGRDHPAQVHRPALGRGARRRSHAGP